MFTEKARVDNGRVRVVVSIKADEGPVLFTIRVCWSIGWPVAWLELFLQSACCLLLRKVVLGRRLRTNIEQTLARECTSFKFGSFDFPVRSFRV